MSRKDVLPTVIFLSHTHDGGTYKVGSHHLAFAFAKEGYRVLHVSTPHSLVHSLLGKGAEGRKLVADLGPRMDENGVLHWVPKTTFPAQVVAESYIRKLQQIMSQPKAKFVFIDQPLFAGHRMLSLGEVTVYRPTDFYLSGTMKSRQHMAVQLAHGVAATSNEVLQGLPKIPGQPRTVIENGVDFARFAVKNKLEQRTGMVYVGALDERFDWSAVIRVAEAFPQVPISIAGPRGFEPNKLPPNVRLIGAISYSEVPELLARSRIGLMPFSRHPLNEGRSPMKLYEYLAAGLHVLSSSFPAAQRVPASAGISIYSNEDDAVGKARFLMEKGINHAGEQEALDSDWKMKARHLENFAKEILQKKQ